MITAAPGHPVMAQRASAIGQRGFTWSSRRFRRLPAVRPFSTL